MFYIAYNLNNPKTIITKIIIVIFVQNILLYHFLNAHRGTEENNFFETQRISHILHLTQVILVLNIYNIYLALVYFLKRKLSLLLNLETDFSFVELKCPPKNAVLVGLIPK